MLCEKCLAGLKACAEKGIITKVQLELLEQYLNNPEQPVAVTVLPEEKKGFNSVMVLYYTGALIILSAFGWFMGKNWDALGAGGVFILSLVYAGVFWFTGNYLIKKEGYPVAGGLLIACCVGMTPLAVYSLESLFGLLPSSGIRAYRDYYVWVNGSWIVIELSTVLAAVLAIKRVRFPFLVMPAAIALWFFSMDVAEIVFTRHELTWELRSYISVAAGLCFLLSGWLAERRSLGVDYPFWIYLAGLLAFWGGLTSIHSDSELGKAFYCLINAGLIAAGLYLGRKTFAVFGAMGIYIYLGHLAFKVFKDSPAFPLVLALFGLMMILSTVLLQKNYTRIQNWLRSVQAGTEK